MASDLTSVTNNPETVLSEPNALINNLKELMQDTDSSDVEFIVGKTKRHFTAHSLILKMRCDKFRDWETTLEHKSPVIITEEDFSSAVFKNVLEYIYTGMMEFTPENMLETLRIAHKLKIPDLVLACEQFLLKKLSITNCCHFFMDSLNVLNTKDYQKLDEVENLVSECRRFIEENAIEVVQTEGFLYLSKEALIQLVSSDHFALPEEEVWYAILKWSKYQAKVKEPVKNWSDNERKIICAYLKDLIGYVRILLIDSKIFAEEVEPTGAVPIELSLQRYRYAAVPDTFHGNDDRCLRSRVNHKLFQDTTILQKNVKYQEILNKWLGFEHQEWRLLYKGSRDGFSSKIFHQKCDGFSQTYTVVKGLNGNICGGFTDISWRNESGNGKYLESTRSFVFTLVNSESIPPTKFDILRPKYSILTHSSFGPTFGAGADLCISNECNIKINSYSNFPHTYGGNVASERLLMGEKYFKVADYEVFCPKYELK